MKNKRGRGIKERIIQGSHQRMEREEQVQLKRDQTDNKIRSTYEMLPDFNN